MDKKDSVGIRVSRCRPRPRPDLESGSTVGIPAEVRKKGRMRRKTSPLRPVAFDLRGFKGRPLPPVPLKRSCAISRGLAVPF